jgi:hypothetical protein
MRHLILAACCLFGTGCATIFKGSNEKVSFSTEPENASVYVNGMYSGKGAFQQNLASNGTYAVECRRLGYEAKSQTINHSVGAGWIILDVLGGFVPADHRCGNWELDPARQHHRALLARAGRGGEGSAARAADSEARRDGERSLTALHGGGTLRQRPASICVSAALSCASAGE